MKVVIDTNVLIDGMKDEYSYQKRIIDAIRAGEIEAYANRQTLQENRLIMHQLIDNPSYEKELNEFLDQVNWVVNRRQVHIVRDPEDNKILESAVEAGADFLITSDNDLLQLEEYHRVKIVNPSEFWGKYQDGEGDDTWKKWTNFISGR